MTEPNPSMDERIARLLRVFCVGDRVRAATTIVYGTGDEVPEGTVGRVVRTNVYGCSPLVMVAWNGPWHTCVSVVSVDSLDPEVVS